MVSFSDQYVFLCALASFLFGYQLAVLNTSISFFTLQFNTCGNSYTYKCPEAVSYESLAGSMVFLGATLGALVAGNISSMFGRRSTLLVTHFISIIGSAVCFFAYNFPMLIGGRLVVGLCVGLVTVASPSFISEICPDKTRGSRGVFHQLFITVGILIAIMLGLFLNQPPEVPDSSYFLPIFERYFIRFMMALPGILSVTAIVLMFSIYRADTPLSLIQKGKTKAAKDVLSKLYLPSEVDAWLEKNTSSSTEKKETAQYTVPLKTIFTEKQYLKPLIIGILLSLGQQLGGINAFVTMSNKIFIDSGMTSDVASQASTGMALANVLMTFPAILLIDTLGRKPLLLIGTAGQAICLALVPISYFTEYRDYLPTTAVIAVVGYIVFFSIAQGPVLWVYIFEMFPPESKGFCSSFASSLNWVTGAIVVYLNGMFSSDEYTIPKFIIFSTLCVVWVIFIGIFIKETKGCSRSPYSPESTVEERIPLTADSVPV